ncbi:MAG: RluA family pseudouridine synthase [Nitrospinales bacterium]
MTELTYLPPAEQVYKSYLPGRYIGYRVDRYFADRFTYHSVEEWASRIRAGDITINGNKVEPDTILAEQDYIVTRLEPRAEPPANRNLDIIFEDENLRVFNKAAPIPVHPCGRYFKNSMTEVLKETYPEEIPRPVQRLDAETTGALVFAKTREAAALIMEEFSCNRVTKVYLALVEGIPSEKEFTVDAPVGKTKGSKRGIGDELINPKSASTSFELMSTIGNRSLLRVTPLSGRTNQIRVHLASVNLAIINDKVYGEPCEPLDQFGLHAYSLKFKFNDTEMDIKASWPGHFQPFIDVSEINV